MFSVTEFVIYPSNEMHMVNQNKQSVSDGEQHATYCDDKYCLTHRGSNTPAKSLHKLTETQTHSVHACLGPNLTYPSCQIWDKISMLYFIFFKERKKSILTNTK